MSSHAHGLEPEEAACRDADHDDRVEARSQSLLTVTGLTAAGVLGIIVGRADWLTLALTLLLAAALALAVAAAAQARDRWRL